MAGVHEVDGVHEVEAPQQGWDTLAALAVALAAIGVGIYVTAKPLWRELITEPRALARAKALVEADAKAGNEYLARRLDTTAPAVYSTAGEERCDGCFARGAGFKLCSKCVDQRVANPARFCSAECLSLAWPTHKKWHASQKQSRPPSQQQPAVDADQPALAQGGTAEGEGLDQEMLERAVRAAEANGSRISVPAKRPTKHKKAPSGAAKGDQGAQAANGGSKHASQTREGSSAVEEYETSIDKAQQQQRSRERTQLGAALAHMLRQLERDNGVGPGELPPLTRAELGNLLGQVGTHLGASYTEQQLDGLFASAAVDDRVDLAAFVARPSTVEFLLADVEEASPKEKRAGRVAAVTELDDLD